MLEFVEQRLSDMVRWTSMFLPAPKAVIVCRLVTLLECWSQCVTLDPEHRCIDALFKGERESLDDATEDFVHERVRRARAWMAQARA